MSKSEHKSESLHTLYTIYISLMVLLVLTVVAASVPFGKWGLDWMSLVLAMTIATIKAVLVILFFMHVRLSSKITWIFSGAAFIWLGVLLVLTMAEYVSRPWVPRSGKDQLEYSSFQAEPGDAAPAPTVENSPHP